MMFRTLSAFYTSDLWKNFRRGLIQERTDSNVGFVIDEYSGEPILHDYDIIAHHKTELTLQNVNDFDISLNPDNIMLVSHRSHNAIHSRFGYASGRKVYYIYGAPCSGKSSYVESIRGNSDIICDIDLIWQALTDKRYYKPDALKSNAFSLYNALLEQIKTRQGKWQRAYIIAGGAHKGDRERLIQSLGAEPIFIDTPKETCIEHLYSDEERVNVRSEWEGYIDTWFTRFIP